MLYYCMQPDNVNEPFPVFTRSGKLSPNLDAVMNRAKRCHGKVYSTDGSNTALIRSFWTDPEPKPKLTPKQYRQARFDALFAY